MTKLLLVIAALSVCSVPAFAGPMQPHIRGAHRDRIHGSLADRAQHHDGMRRHGGKRHRR